MPSFTLAPSHLIEDLSEFVRDEFAFQRRAFAENAALPVEERVEKGICLSGLNFKSLDDKGRVCFTHGGNDSRLREGDLVRLHRGDMEQSVSCSIYREEAGEIWLAGESKFKPAAFFENPSGWMIDESFIDLESHYLTALEQLAKTEIGQERILPLLLGNADNVPNMDEYEAIYNELDDPNAATQWEDSQMEAIASCVAASHCYLVQGPPGTGKTRVLAQVVARLVALGERVLITSATHRAIDNALSAAAREIGDRSRVARFAATTHLRPADYDAYESIDQSPLAHQSAWVAGATPFALKKRLSTIQFDTVVVDEASQMTTPLAIMAMLTGKKFLFFGDQHQLGPVILSRSRRDIARYGIFRALQKRADATMLDVTYRLNDTLTHWPSENFYHGELTPARGAAARRLQCFPSADTEDWVKEALSPERPLVWMPFPASRSRTRNGAEIAVAARLLQALTQSGVSQESIAVVTPYRRQARHLRNRIEQMTPGQSWRACLIDTVERMQGQEREVILASLCAAEPGFIHRQFDFLLDPRRLNVAATRARTKLIILANDNLISCDPMDSDKQEDLDLLRSLKASARPVNPPAQL